MRFYFPRGKKILARQIAQKNPDWYTVKRLKIVAFKTQVVCRKQEISSSVWSAGLVYARTCLPIQPFWQKSAKIPRFLPSEVPKICATWENLQKLCIMVYRSALLRIVPYRSVFCCVLSRILLRIVPY